MPITGRNDTYRACMGSRAARGNLCPGTFALCAARRFNYSLAASSLAARPPGCRPSLFGERASAARAVPVNGSNFTTAFRRAPLWPPPPWSTPPQLRGAAVRAVAASRRHARACGEGLEAARLLGIRANEKFILFFIWWCFCLTFFYALRRFWRPRAVPLGMAMPAPGAEAEPSDQPARETQTASSEGARRSDFPRAVRVASRVACAARPLVMRPPPPACGRI